MSPAVGGVEGEFAGVATLEDEGALVCVARADGPGGGVLGPVRPSWVVLPLIFNCVGNHFLIMGREF